jgi:hypothetical protein
MKQEKYSSQNLFSDAHVRKLRARYEQIKNQISQLDWVTQGSVTANKPGSWRWTRKVKAKTVTVTLSNQQAELFRDAITNYRTLENLVREMRQISQKVLLLSIPGPKRQKPLSLS